jgi:hypothetical protein
MAGSSSSSSRKIGRASRWGGQSHSSSLYVAKHGSGYRARKDRGNLYHRRPAVCSNCQTKQGPFTAGFLPGSHLCTTTVRGSERVRALELAILECNKRRGIVDRERYSIKPS